MSFVIHAGEQHTHGLRQQCYVLNMLLVTYSICSPLAMFLSMGDKSIIPLSFEELDM